MTYATATAATDFTKAVRARTPPFGLSAYPRKQRSRRSAWGWRWHSRPTDMYMLPMPQKMAPTGPNDRAVEEFPEAESESRVRSASGHFAAVHNRMPREALPFGLFTVLRGLVARIVSEYWYKCSRLCTMGLPAMRLPASEL